jgi:hypothetical protein
MVFILTMLVTFKFTITKKRENSHPDLSFINPNDEDRMHLLPFSVRNTRSKETQLPVIEYVIVLRLGAANCAYNQMYILYYHYSYCTLYPYIFHNGIKLLTNAPTII